VLLFLKFIRKMVGAFAYPSKWVFRIASLDWFDKRLKVAEQCGIMMGECLSSTSLFSYSVYAFSLFPLRYLSYPNVYTFS
jgi:hypothetical protein